MFLGQPRQVVLASGDSGLVGSALEYGIVRTPQTGCTVRTTAGTLPLPPPERSPAGPEATPHQLQQIGVGSVRCLCGTKELITQGFRVGRMGRGSFVQPRVGRCGRRCSHRSRLFTSINLRPQTAHAANVRAPAGPHRQEPEVTVNRTSCDARTNASSAFCRST